MYYLLEPEVEVQLKHKGHASAFIHSSLRLVLRMTVIPVRSRPADKTREKLSKSLAEARNRFQAQNGMIVFATLSRQPAQSHRNVFSSEIHWDQKK